MIDLMLKFKKKKIKCTVIATNNCDIIITVNRTYRQAGQPAG